MNSGDNPCTDKTPEDTFTNPAAEVKFRLKLHLMSPNVCPRSSRRKKPDPMSILDPYQSYGSGSKNVSAQPAVEITIKYIKMTSLLPFVLHTWTPVRARDSRQRRFIVSTQEVLVNLWHGTSIGRTV
jgi:hypothetical protein